MANRQDRYGLGPRHAMRGLCGGFPQLATITEPRLRLPRGCQPERPPIPDLRISYELAGDLFESLHAVSLEHLDKRPDTSGRMANRQDRYGLGPRHAMRGLCGGFPQLATDRKSTRLNSSHRCISYAVFCLKKKRDLPLITGAHPRTPHQEIGHTATCPT